MNQGRRTIDFNLAAGASFIIAPTTTWGWVSVFTEAGDYGSFMLNGANGSVGSSSGLNIGFLIGGILGNNIISTSGGNFTIKNNTLGALNYHVVYQLYSPE